jgi:tetratricopeptide (TPR) repeat protein
MDETEKYEILKKEVDSLQIQLSADKKPFFKNPSTIIAIVALIFSFGTTVISYVKSYQEEIRANRREARELIQRLSRLPIESFELTKKHEGSPQGASLNRLVNQENVLLATQAVELIKRYPDSFSSNEFFSVASAFFQSNLKDNIPYLLNNAIKRARNYNDYNVSTRALASLYYSQSDFTEGRKLYEKAMAVWDIYPESNHSIVTYTNVDTLMFWSDAELSIYNFSAARDLIERAKNYLQELPPSHFSANLEIQVADVEKRIQEMEEYMVEGTR